MNLPTNNVQSIPYRVDGSEWGSRLADLEGFACLESCKRDPQSGRFDIITALPTRCLSVMDFGGDGSAWMASVEDALACASDQQSRIAIGFLDFETATEAALGLSYPALTPAVAAIYSWWVLQDHHSRTAWLVKSPDLPMDIAEVVVERLLEPSGKSDNNIILKQNFRPDYSRHFFEENVRKVRSLIAAGDCYQANIAQRFSARYEGDGFNIYQQLRQVASGDFSGFLALQTGHAVASFSPERFLSTANGEIFSQPIKGTRARAADAAEDQALAAALLASEKDRAENVMIVDLLRNDLGKICRTGSVKVTELCQLYSYDNVHHLVSRIEGMLADNVTPGMALIKSSPGGSITGAPKKRAVEIIKTLETAPRGVYCGSIFVMDNRGWMESSIAIRTLEFDGNDIYCWGGGGITWDSDPAAEFQETLDKIQGFMLALES
ncbi:MAG: anthranilate synthase component I family protein [Cellvibrionales bacterium]